MQEPKEENQSYGDYSSKMSMLEMLTGNYEWNLNHGNGGHLFGNYCKIKEKVASEYLFPEGKFTLKQMEERFFLWNYDPLLSKTSDIFKNKPNFC
ncbi:MAG: hypothetical protein Q8R47_03435 [Nanoarchaeota archaeon]|nr:hypothetical protein [Nanoarchaeota archaeon]